MSKLMQFGTTRKGGPERLCLAVPTYGAVSPVFLWSLLKGQQALTEAGIEHEVMILSGHCHVDDARNCLVRAFLASDCTDLVFIDADLGFEGSELVKLAGYERDVVAGIYPLKQDGEDFPCNTLPGEIWAQADGLIEVLQVPAGFLKIKRHVLESLADKASTYLERPDDADVTPLLFERSLESGKRFSGDYTFCRKWRAVGGKIYVDPELSFSHCGEKEWSGSYGSFLRHRNGLALSGIKKIQRGDFSTETFCNLFDDWRNQYAASPELLMACAELARESTGPILELGSGLSTLVMAAANPNVIVHAIENDSGWHMKVQAEIWKQGMTNIVLHKSSIRNYGAYNWYNEEDVPELPFALVLCDGPARAIGNRAGLFEHCADRLVDAVILMDDAIDPTQTEPLEKWASSHGRTVEFMAASRPFALSVPRVDLSLRTA